MQSQIKILQDTVQDLGTLNKHLQSETNALIAKDAKVKAIEAETTLREEERNKDFEMLKTKLAQEQAKVAQKQ